VMFVDPALTPVAEPLGVMVATPVCEDAQVTVPVRFWMLELLNVPVAAYCTLPEGEMVLLAGVTAIDCKVALLTVSMLEPLANGPPGLVNVALIDAEPWARALATP
jgi:hypothetical protein